MIEGRWELDEGDLPAPPAADRAAEVRVEVARDALERALAPASRGKSFSVTGLLAAVAKDSMSAAPLFEQTLALAAEIRP